jgi:hypothetical protein
MNTSINSKLNDEEWLREQYINNSRTARSIADEIGVHWQAVTRALKRHNIPRRKRTSKYPQLNDKEWLRVQYVDLGLSAKEIADQIGATRGTVYSALAPAGIKPRSNDEGWTLKFPNGRHGNSAANWKGGRRIIGGYVYIYMPDHPNARRNGAVQEHRLIMEKHLGRYLADDEIVHHIDGNKQNNLIENLELMKRGQHSHHHFENVTELRKQIAELEQEIERLKDKLERFEGHRID